jgi:hypothetical protein
VSAVFHRRRVERFAQLLDEAEGGIRHHSRSSLDSELAPLVDLGQQVNELNQLAAPDPRFRSDLRTMLLAAAQRDGIGITAVTSPEDTRPSRRRPVTSLAGNRRQVPRRLRTRGLIIVGIAAGTLALSGISTASIDALPGDALYGVKRSTERAQLALASSDVSRGQLYLEFAKTRVAEAYAVRQDPAGLVAILDDLDAETRQGVKLLHTAAVERQDPAALDVVDRFVEDQQRKIVALLENQPAAVRPRVLESLRLLESVTRRTDALRTALNCGATSVGADALGPLPGTCRAAGTSEVPEPETSGEPTQSSPTEQANPAPVDQGGNGNTKRPAVPAPGGGRADDDEGGPLRDLGRFLDHLLGG